MIEVMLGILILVSAVIVLYVIGLVVSSIVDSTASGSKDLIGNMLVGTITSASIMTIVWIAYMIGFDIMHG
jgi:hypothetical protein